MTLLDVVEFYTRGGDFRLQNQDNVDVLIGGIPALQHNPTGQAALVAFLQSMTDDRVRNQAAPFDHPEILIPNGDPEVLIRVPARDQNGAVAPPLSLLRVLLAMVAAIGVGRVLPHAGKIVTPVYAALVGISYVLILLVTRELASEDLATVRAVVSKRRAR